MDKVRSFIAIEIPEKIRSEINYLCKSFAKQDFSVKWVEKQNLHITMLFLGDVTNEFIEKGCGGLEKIVQTQRPFQLSLAGISAFPGLKQPRIIWIGADQGVAEITDLQAKIETAFIEIGYKPENRKFHPHVTIGRVKYRFTYPKIFETIYKSENFFVKSVVLFNSILKLSGPIYEKIREFDIS